MTNIIKKIADGSLFSNQYFYLQSVVWCQNNLIFCNDITIESSIRKTTSDHERRGGGKFSPVIIDNQTKQCRILWQSEKCDTFLTTNFFSKQLSLPSSPDFFFSGLLINGQLPIFLLPLVVLLLMFWKSNHHLCHFGCEGKRKLKKRKSSYGDYF